MRKIGLAIVFVLVPLLLLLFSSVIRADATPASGVNCTGFDGTTLFECVGENNRVCSSIVVNEVPVVQCRGIKRARPTEADPNL